MTRQPRAALIEITPRQPLGAGKWRLNYDPLRAGRWPLRNHPSVPIAFAVRGLLRALKGRDFSLRDFSAEPVLDPGLLPREIRVEPAIGAPGHGGLTEDFVDARRRSPIAIGGADGTAYWSDVGRVEVRYPAAAGSGADGDVRLRGAQSQSDVEALSLTLAAGETCTLKPEPGLVVLRAQSRISIAGRLARTTGASAPAATLAAWQRRPADARPLETLSAWLEGVRERDEDWTVLIAGGDLVIDGELTTTTPLCLCAGGVIRVSGAVRGVANQVFLLREGGGLNIDPPASFAPLSIDPPRDRNPLVRPLHLAVLSSPIPPSAGVLRWLSAEARGSGARPDVRPGGAAASWRVRYVPEIRGDRADLAALAPAASPIELDRPDRPGRNGPLQILIELEVEPGGAWDPPWVDYVRLAWEGH